MKLKSLYRYLKPPRGFHLTKSGRLFFVFLFGIILSAMLTGNNLLFLILACMLSFMIVSGIQSERNLRHLEIERIMPAEIYARIPVRVGYAIRNMRNPSSRLILSDFKKIKIPRLGKSSLEMVDTDVVFPHRGTIELGRVVISTTFPYSLFRKSITFDLEGCAVVFPEPIACIPPFNSGRAGSGSGKEQDSISHVRSYYPGDPLSSIVWKKQHLGLVSRVAEGGSGSSTLVVLLPGQDLEQKLGRATFLVQELSRTTQPFGLIMNSYFSGMATGRSHKIEIMKHLADCSELSKPYTEGVQHNGQDIVYL
ncbi:MAG: hypothetical protein ACP5G0_00685 [Desulfomonilia bacterium]